MGGTRALAITLTALLLEAAAALAAGEIHGTVRCADRCAGFVVHLEGVDGAYSGAGEVVELGQENKLFVPRVVAMLEGSTLRIGNGDPFMHNVHARKDGKTLFNVNLPFQYQTLDQVVAEAGVYRLTCEPHPEMLGFLVVLDNPFFARPDEAGRFRITAVPAGSYRLVSLDAESGRRRQRTVQVGGGVVRVDF